jgi:hypothetical protein
MDLKRILNNYHESLNGKQNEEVLSFLKLSLQNKD